MKNVNFKKHLFNAARHSRLFKEPVRDEVSAMS